MKIYLSEELLKALPKPSKDQSEKEFISSCMSNDTMKSEFPDRDQRVAVCYKQWRGPETKKSLTLCGMFKAWSAEARAAAAEARRDAVEVKRDIADERREKLIGARGRVGDRPSRRLAQPADWRRRMKQEELLAPYVEKLPAEALIRRRATYLDSAYYQRKLAERVAREKSLTSGPMTLAKAWSPEARAETAEAE